MSILNLKDNRSSEQLVKDLEFNIAQIEPAEDGVHLIIPPELVLDIREIRNRLNK